jgi:sugar phosphate isomerase/epimerase
VEYITTSNNELKKIKSLKELKKYCDYYNALGKLCKQKGIIFGFHNHADEFEKIEGETIYDFLLKNTNPEYVHFQMDLYWIKKGGADPISYFNKYPNRFFSWHIKDEKELGKSGEMDFGNIFKYAKKAGIKYNIAEVEQYNFDPLVSVEMAYRYLYSFDFEKK